MRKNVVLLIFYIFSQAIYSQNLLRNSSFEQNKGCEGDFISIHKNLEDWNLTVLGGLMGSSIPINSAWIDTVCLPVLQRKCPLDSVFIEVYPKSGSCYIRNNSTYYQHFFEQKLEKKLETNEYYYFEMYYRLMSLSKQLNKVPTGAIGAYFTTENINDSLVFYNLRKNKLVYEPQIRIKNLDSCANENWIKLSGVFKANHDFRYIWLGNHRDFEVLLGEPNIKSADYEVGSIGKRSIHSEAINYYIDDVLLIKYDDLATVNVDITNQWLTFISEDFENRTELTEIEKKRLNIPLNFLKKNKNAKIEFRLYFQGLSNEKQLITKLETFFLANGIKKERFDISFYSKFDNIAIENRNYTLEKNTWIGFLLKKN